MLDIASRPNFKDSQLFRGLICRVLLCDAARGETAVMGPVRDSCSQSLKIEADSTSVALCAFENKTTDKNFRTVNGNFLFFIAIFAEDVNDGK